MSFRELRQKILEVFETMQERFRNTKPTIALIDALAITNQGYSYIQEDLDKQEKQLREKLKNRPKKVRIDDSHFYYKAVLVERWFEGFEEEIRSRLAWLTPDMDKTMMSCRDFRRFIEEILGDKIAEIEGEG